MKNARNRKRRLAAIAFAGIQTIASGAGASLVATVALSRQSAPGTSDGATYAGFGVPLINSAGQVAFSATLAGSSVNVGTDGGIWFGSPNTLTLAARIGNLAPGLGNGVTFTNFGAVSLDDAGEVGTVGNVTGASVTSIGSAGVFATRNGTMQLVAIGGAPAVGAPVGVMYTPAFPGPIPLSGHATEVFSDQIFGPGISPGANHGLWSSVTTGTATTVTLIAKEGNPAPGQAANYFGIGPAKILTNGNYAFFAALSTAGPATLHAGSIWTGSVGSTAAPQLLVKEGDSAPGTSPSVVFSFLNQPQINSAGQIAFASNIAGGNLDPTILNRGIWLSSGGTITNIIKNGDPAPGTADLFSEPSQPAMADNGTIVFGSSVDGADVVSGVNDRGVWIVRGSSIKNVMRAGTQTPGTVPGVQFGDDFPAILSVNGAGQLAFNDSLIGTGVDSTNNSAIFATDLGGQLYLIARTGELFDVDPGLGTDFRTIASLSLATNANGEDGRGGSFNSVGNLVFGATFTDGSSGIFVSLVPEPTSLGLIAFTAGIVALRRRQTRFSGSVV